MSDASDLELLRAWRAGDAEAGEALFRRHFVRIYRFFRSKVGSDAEDLSQRTFLALVEGREEMRPDSNFRAYAFGIARNQLLMHFRRLGSGRQSDLELRSVADLSKAGAETGLRKGEELRLVLQAMRRLPLDFQVALELYYWEEMGVGDIATVLGVAPGTVKSRLFRGRDMLRKELETIEAPDVLRESTLNNLNQWIAALRDGIEGESGG